MKGGSYNESLFDACRDGNIDRVRGFLLWADHINVRNKLGQTPLHVAIERDHTKVALYLIKQGADINVRNNRGQTPLHVAIERGHTELALYLIEKLTNANLT